MRHPCITSGPNGGPCKQYRPGDHDCHCDLKTRYLAEIEHGHGMRVIKADAAAPKPPPKMIDPPATDHSDEKIIAKCKKCGRAKPFTAEYFKRGRHGLTETCKECWLQSIRRGRERRKKQQTDQPIEKKPAPVIKSEPPQQKIEPPVIRNRIDLPEGEAPRAVIDAIRETARQEYRSFGNQVLYILDRYLKARNGKEVVP